MITSVISRCVSLFQGSSKRFVFLPALLSLALPCSKAPAQTRCGAEHPGTGVFICYPNPETHPEDGNLPTFFHLSAQATAPAGRKVGRFSVSIDDQRVYENKFAMPLEQVSIETNIHAPPDSELHKITVNVDGTGSATVAGVRFNRTTGLGFCDTFHRVGPRTCVPGSYRGPLDWMPGREGNKRPKLLEDYVDFAHLWTSNLKSVEADAADAVAVDAKGVLYAASHVSADIELRKYSRNGSLIYDGLVRACGQGFTSVAALVADQDGHVWIAANSTACFSPTANALETHAGSSTGNHGIVVSLDTHKPASEPPSYLTYLSRVEHHIAAMRVDSAGNAYLTGTSASPQYPHRVTFSRELNQAGVPAAAANSPVSFVSVLNSSGSAMQWSALLPGVRLNALAIDTAGEVCVTGNAERLISGRRTPQPLVGILSDRGQRISYFGQLAQTTMGEGRSISVLGNNWMLVTGDSSGSRSFLVAIEPCMSGRIASQELSAITDALDLPDIARQPSLDAFASGFSQARAHSLEGAAARSNPVSGKIAPPCASPAS